MLQGGLLVGALALSISSLVVGGVAAIAAPTPAYAASKKSSKKSKKDPLEGIKVKKKVDKYSWEELAKISDAMTKSGSRKAALKIAKKYKLCDKKGKLDGSQTKRMTLSDCESTVTIVGLYHDDLADGSGKAGLTWQFTDGLYMGSPLYAFYADGFDIFPSSVQDRLATISKKTVYLDGAKTSEATSEDVKMWAPSATECLGDAEDMPGVNRDSEWMAKSLNAEGSQYDYYEYLGLSWANSTGSAGDTDIECPYGIASADSGQGGLTLKGGYGPFKSMGSGFRSIYYDPSKPDADLTFLSEMGFQAYSCSDRVGGGVVYACDNNNTWANDEGNCVDVAVMPMFCLTASSADDAATESNGVAIQDSVDNYSWKDLKTIADEIATAQDDDSATGIAKKYHLVSEDGTLSDACYKTVKLSTGAEVKAYIVGFNHDDRADGKGKAGITFMVCGTPVLSDSINEDGSNTGGWKDSDVRKSLNKKVLASMPKDLKKNIVKVTKLTNNAGVTTDASSVTSTDDSLWLPSLVELFGNDGLERSLGSNRSDAFPVYEAEGSQYKTWYKTTGPAWTRTCDASQSGQFLTYNGMNFSGSAKSSSNNDIYLGFCL